MAQPPRIMSETALSAGDAGMDGVGAETSYKT